MAASFSLTGSLRLDPRWTDDLNTTTVLDSARANLSFALADGDGADEADGYFKDVVTVAAAGTHTYDLTDLTRNVFGGSAGLDLAAVKVILIRNRSETAAVTVALGTSVTGSLDPLGVLYATSMETGWAEATLTITNAGASAADVEVYLAGVQT